MKKALTFVAGLVGVAVFVGVLWLLGWAGRLVGLVQATDPAPNALVGMLGIMIAIVVAMVSFGTYMLGRWIVCKFTDEEFPF